MRCAIVTNGTVTNIIEATADFAESIGAVEIPNGYGIGDKCVDGLWEYGEKLVPEPSPPEQPESPLPKVDLEQLALDHEYRLSMLEIGI